MAGEPGTSTNELAAEGLIAQCARLAEMRRSLGEHLADFRYAAGVPQTDLATALDRTSSMVSKVEHGEKCPSAPLWEIADTLCRADGALLAEYRPRIARAVNEPDRTDSEVVHHLGLMLAQARRLYDRLGPGPVLESFLGQHQLIHHLLTECREGQVRQRLRVLDSIAASEIGACLIDLLGQPKAARRWFTHARKAAHQGGTAPTPPWRPVTSAIRRGSPGTPVPRWTPLQRPATSPPVPVPPG